MTQHLQFERKELTPQDDLHFAECISSVGMQIIESIIRSRMSLALIMAGESLVEVGDGTEGQKDEVDKMCAKALKYKNFLEIIEELKSPGVKYVEKIRDV